MEPPCLESTCPANTNLFYSMESSSALRARGLLDGSTFLRQAMGDDVVDHYVHTADWEQFEFDRRVTDLELKRGFERY